MLAASGMKIITPTAEQDIDEIFMKAAFVDLSCGELLSK